ncbi:lipopolysaccharide biosynthesis protein [Labrys miyagiensis]
MGVESIALSKKTAVAGVWSVGARLLAKSVDFVSLILLARFLGPADFGLVAMAMTLIFVVEAIFEMPLSAALTRIPDPTRRMYDTAFTLSTLRGIAIGTVLGAISWPLAHFYNEPRLVYLIIALAFAPILRGLVSPRMVHFAKQMDFRRQAFMDVLSKVVAGMTAVATAALTQSYWSIALGTILTPTILMVGSYILAPMRPRLTLKDWPLFADMVGWSMLTQILLAINWQLGRFILPRFVDTVSFGRYAMANDLAGIPYQTLVAPLDFPLNVAFVTAHQKGDLKSTYLKASGALIILLLPIFTFAGLMSEPLIDLFLGSKWQGAAILLSGLALASIVQAPATPMPMLAISLNQSRRITLRSLVQCLALVPLTLLGVSLYGVYGAVMASCAVAFIVTFMTMLTVRAMIGASMKEQLISIAGPAMAGLASGAVLFYGTYFFTPNVSFLMLLVQIGILGLVYVGAYVASIYAVSRWFKSTAGAEQLIVSMGLATLAKVRRTALRG